MLNIPFAYTILGTNSVTTGQNLLKIIVFLLCHCHWYLVNKDRINKSRHWLMLCKDHLHWTECLLQFEVVRRISLQKLFLSLAHSKPQQQWINLHFS